MTLAQISPNEFIVSSYMRGIILTIKLYQKKSESKKKHINIVVQRSRKRPQAVDFAALFCL